MRFDLDVEGRPRTVTLESRSGALVATLDGRSIDLEAVRLGPGRYSLRLPGSGRQHELRVAPGPRAGLFEVAVGGVAVTVARRAPGRAARRGEDRDGPARILAPMPGKVVRVLVKAGDEVAARQGVVVVEAMKMENELRTGRAGVVREVLVTEGASVEAGALLVVLE